MNELNFEGQPPSAVRRVQEYKHEGVDWRVNRFDLLTAEFELPHSKLPEFHAAICRDARRWMIVRRVFGVTPVVPSLTADPEDLRTWERAELMEALGLTRAHLQQELDAVRGLWSRQAGPPEELKSKPTPAVPSTPDGQFVFQEEEILRKYGFSDAIFAVQDRDSTLNREEKEFFAKRVEEWKKIFDHPVAKSLGRQALLNELQLRRLEIELVRHPIGGESYRKMLRLQQDLETAYQNQLKQIDEVAPWLGAIAGKMAFKGVISDLVKAYEEYKKDGSTELIDGVFTATEIQVLCRRSVQMPEPQYRAGLVTYLQAARAGMFDPNWRPQFKASQLKKLDSAWKAAFVAEAEASDDPLPDLEKDGPEGEYEDLYLPEDTTHPNPPPEGEGNDKTQ